MATTNPPQSIADWYHSCIGIFEKAALSVDNLVAGNHEAKTLLGAPQLVQDQIGRLRVWAGNMGAHRVGKMSLDYKLKEASHIRDTVLELLEELDESLTEGVYTKS